MKSLSRFTPILAIALVALVLTSCGKNLSGKITGPGSGGVPTVSSDFEFKLGGHPAPALNARMARPNGALVDIGVGPAPGDSVFLNGMLANPMGDPATSWEARAFIGLLKTDGTLDRTYTAVVPNEQRDYEFALSFKDQGIEYQYLGPISVNGVPLTAWDYTKFVIWRAFRFVPGGTIEPIRDDAPLMAWTECQVTGIVHPDSTMLNQPVSGAEPLSFLSTDTRLITNPGIFVETPAPSSWRFPVFAKKGETFLIRCNRPLGSSVLPGVFLKNADGSWLQLINLFDLTASTSAMAHVRWAAEVSGRRLAVPGQATSTYFVFEAVYGADGMWSNPRPNVDERYGRIVIGG